MTPTEMDHVLIELEVILVSRQKVPVEPADLVILTVAVVVAVLGVSEFIARQDHGRTAAAHKNGDRISHHLETKGFDLGISRLSLFAAVPAAVIVGAVIVVPTVGFVVLAVVGI